MDYQAAKKEYAAFGVDTEKAIERLSDIPVSLHCWQGDDVQGFLNKGALSGGIQTTGNYPGKARTFEELTGQKARQPARHLCRQRRPGGSR